ncbi:MAG: sulfite exporter TauE/SafE family protein [Clostridiales bacterium]|nr:sulfite exporter TauE/SafE family protein [Candidatus Cacconaster stercorequi]
MVGLGTGILSAWGVGGGTLLLLIMTLFLGVDQTTAQGINLLYFLPTAGMGLLCHRKNGLLDRAVLHSAVLWAIPAAILAAWIATGVDPTLLRKPFGIYLLLAGLTTLVRRQ